MYTQSETESVDLGFGALRAVPGHHIAHFYRTEDEWLDLLVRYQAAGLEAGEKCVYLMRPEREARWREALGALGVDVQAVLDSGQMVLVKDLELATDRVAALSEILTEIGTKYPRLRSGGDVEWTDTHWHWESHIDSVAGPSAVFLCQYEVSTLGGDIVIDAMRTHPVCIVGDAVVPNPLYEEHAEFPG